MCHLLIQSFEDECDLFYLKCATENKSQIIRLEGFKGLITTNPLDHLRLIVYGIVDLNMRIKMICLDYLMNYFRLDQF